MSEAPKINKKETQPKIDEQEIIAKASELMREEMEIDPKKSLEENAKKIEKKLSSKGFFEKFSKKIKMAMAIMIATGIMSGVLPNTAKAETPKEGKKIEIALTGQERASLTRAIDVAVQAKQITPEEAGALKMLIQMDKGWAGMLGEYVNKYKRSGRTMDDFMADVYAGTIGEPKKG